MRLRYPAALIALGFGALLIDLWFEWSLGTLDCSRPFDLVVCIVSVPARFAIAHLTLLAQALLLAGGVWLLAAAIRRVVRG
ncbi:hypothetical protein [uncultured Jannaschia sp.]|uniref:hypothetical protein n=1 Tax=uncultured Jannaschia sp. TaxID=293347 RepID=UPI002639A7C9|nr:hypothetical protein [uncultured Jannaschia sp.]